MNKMDVKVDFNLLGTFFEGRKNIASVFVFGSSQDGLVKKGSDLDIAILLEGKLEVNEKLNLYSDLCSFLVSIDNVDMVVLNDVDAILAFEAIKGRKIIDNNSELTAGFCSYISRVYEDTMVNVEYQNNLRKNYAQMRDADCAKIL